MGKKKVLFVGDGNHFFVKNLAKKLHDFYPDHIEIDILSLSNVKEENSSYYNKIYFPKVDSLIKKLYVRTRIFYARFIYNKSKYLLKEMNHYDYVHFHFLSPEKYPFVKYFFQLKNTKIVISLWGSDLYRLKRINKKKFRKTCEMATVISLANEQSRNYFIESYKPQNSRIEICRFGLSPLDSIKRLKLNKEDCKKELGWSLGKIALVVGYNMSVEQQHLKIFKVLNQPQLKILKDKILIILPITYGGNQTYKTELIAKIKKLGFDFHVYDKLMNNEEVAVFRKASDIMIQLQVTDQLSGSMLEHLYADNVVVTGSWLPYKILKEKGIKFLEIDSFQELEDKLLGTIKDIDKIKIDIKGNQDRVYKFASWSDTIKYWFELYE